MKTGTGFMFLFVSLCILIVQEMAMGAIPG